MKIRNIIDTSMKDRRIMKGSPEYIMPYTLSLH